MSLVLPLNLCWKPDLKAFTFQQWFIRNRDPIVIDATINHKQCCCDLAIPAMGVNQEDAIAEVTQQGEEL